VEIFSAFHTKPYLNIPFLQSDGNQVGQPENIKTTVNFVFYYNIFDTQVKK
jgi:hypothetical protein